MPFECPFSPSRWGDSMAADKILWRESSRVRRARAHCRVSSRQRVRIAAEGGRKPVAAEFARLYQADLSFVRAREREKDPC